MFSNVNSVCTGCVFGRILLFTGADVILKVKMSIKLSAFVNSLVDCSFCFLYCGFETMYCVFEKLRFVLETMNYVKNKILVFASVAANI
jgi:hypothetical protein